MGLPRRAVVATGLARSPRHSAAPDPVAGVCSTRYGDHPQLLFPVEPEELLLVDQIALPLEQNLQPPIAEAAFIGNRLHALAKAGIVSPGASCISWSCGSSRWLFTPPFAHSECLSQMDDSFRFPAGVTTSFPRVLHRRVVHVASASNRFRRVFSSSSVFSRLALDTSIPPNLAFHRRCWVASTDRRPERPPRAP